VIEEGDGLTGSDENGLPGPATNPR
jgi:hypothetical protein